MHRYGLSVRANTSVGQQLPPYWEVKVAGFRKFCSENLAGVSMEHFYNMDEVPVSFDMPRNYTVKYKGSQDVKIFTTGHEKSNFTVVLCVTANGGRLPPLVIFKRKSFPRNETIPEGIIVKVNPKGWMDAKLMKVWI
jgi:hypothetical protein